jgi:hypothetical protein
LLLSFPGQVKDDQAMGVAPAGFQELLVPMAPSGEQAKFYSGDFAQQMQRIAGSLLVTVLAASKFALLAGGALTFNWWWPWAKAMNKNRSLSSQFKCAEWDTLGPIWPSVEWDVWTLFGSQSKCSGGFQTPGLLWKHGRSVHKPRGALIRERESARTGAC